MSDDRTIPWGQIVIEAVAIVVSILLAFWIDAWWDERQEREDAKVVLSSLRDELTEVSEFMPFHDRYAAALRESARRLLIAAVGNGPPLDDQEIDKLLGDLTWFVGERYFFVPELDSLLLNDDLTLIENTELRRMLKSWKRLNDFFRRNVGYQQRFVESVFIPYLQDNAALQQIHNVADSMPGYPEDTFPIEKIDLRERRSHADLLDDPVFQNILTRRIERLDTMLAAREEAYVSELTALIKLLDKELSQ